MADPNRQAYEAELKRLMDDPDSDIEAEALQSVHDRLVRAKIAAKSALGDRGGEPITVHFVYDQIRDTEDGLYALEGDDGDPIEDPDEEDPEAPDDEPGIDPTTGGPLS